MFHKAMLVKSIDMREFRGIKRFERPLELGGFNVLIGKNNSGKSSILEALFLLPRYMWLNPLSGVHKINYIASLHSGSIYSLVYGYSGSAEIEYILEGNKTVRFSISSNSKEMLSTSQGVLNIQAMDLTSLAEIFTADPDTLYNLTLLLTLDTKNLYNYLYSNINRIIKDRLNYLIIKEIINPAIREKFTELYLRTN